MKDKILQEYINTRSTFEYLKYIHENTKKILSQDKILEPYYSFEYTKKLNKKSNQNY